MTFETVIRPPRDDERKYIRETTLKVLKPSGVQWGDWYDLRHTAVDHWISDPGTRVIADGDFILGFALCEGDILAMLYVRHKAHGYGLGAALMAKVGVRNPGVGMGPWSDLVEAPGVPRRAL